MSSTLTTSSDRLDKPFDGLLTSVLSEQQDVSAVERFAQWHDRTASASEHTSASQTPTLARLYSSLMPATPPAAGQQYAFEVDLDACSGCKACVVACHNLNGLETDETWRKVGWLTSHDSGLPIVQHVTTACHHCVEPGCLNGCPVKAYEKDPLTGIVRHLDDQCFGCQYCTMMCPYEVPQYSSTLGIVRKCDMCSQRINNGEAPACVQACPNKAIRITLVESMNVRILCESSTTTLLPTAPPSHITLPTTTFLTIRDHRTNHLVSHEAIIDHPHEGHWPLVGMLVLTQASVGIWCVLNVLLWSSNRPWNEFLGIALLAASLGIVGVHLALAHLGRPWLAFRAFLGWRTSWLSREAIAFGIFMAVAGLTATAFVGLRLRSQAVFPASGVAGLQGVSMDQAIAWIPSLPMIPTLAECIAPYTRLLVLLSTIVGLVAVACSGMIYIATRRSLWSGSRTGLEFVATMLGLGLASVAINEQGALGANLLLAGSIVSGVGLGAKFLDRERGRRLPRSNPIDWQDFSKRSGRLLHAELSHAWNATWMSWLGAVLVSLMLFLGIAPITLVPTLGGITVVMLFFSQIINRWLYFASIVTYRMPGAST